MYRVRIKNYVDGSLTGGRSIDVVENFGTLELAQAFADSYCDEHPNARPVIEYPEEPR